jgi:hypothetical protein
MATAGVVALDWETRHAEGLISSIRRFNPAEGPV